VTIAARSTVAFDRSGLEDRANSDDPQNAHDEHDD